MIAIVGAFGGSHANAMDFYDADVISKLAEIPMDQAIKMAQVTVAVPLRSPSVSPKPIVPSEVEMVIELTERGNYLGDLAVIIRNDEPYFDGSRISELLATIVAPSTVERLKVLGNGGKIGVKDLKNAGLNAVWDPGLLSIDVKVNASDKEKREIEVAKLEREDKGLFYQPAKVGLFANVRTSLDYDHFGTDKGFEKPFFDFNLGGRIFGVSFDNYFTYDTSGIGLRRSSSSFIFDNELKAVRTVVGDIRPQVSGYQSGFEALGFSWASSYQTLQPYKNLRPRGEGSFTLEEPSTVDVVINGRVVNRLKLDSGNYDLKDFPFLDGENRVQFIAEDRTGRREIAKFDMFFDRSLLAKGLSEWAFSIGSTTKHGTKGPDYSNGKFVASGFFRQGISNSVTMGGNLQLNGKSGLAGFDILRALKIGVLGLDVAQSWSNTNGGTAFNLNFNRTTDSSNTSGAINWGIGVSSRTKYFGTTEDSIANNSQAWDASVFMSRFLGSNGANFNASVNYSKGRSTFEDTWSVRFGYGQNLTKKLGFNADVSYSDNRFGKDWVFRIQLSTRFGSNGSTVFSHESKDKRFNLGMQNSGNFGLGHWGLNAVVDSSKTSSGFNGSAFLSGNRGDIGLTHATYFDNGFAQKVDERSSLRLATGFAFADGAFAWGKPVFGAFAIPVAHQTLKGHQIKVGSGGGDDVVASKFFGSPLIGSIPNYARRDLNVDVVDLPEGYDLGSGVISVRAPYNAGYKIVVGNQDNLTIIGRALDEDNLPIAFIAGMATRKKDNKKVELFTNGKGIFYAAGLGPGDWEIALNTKPNKTKLKINLSAKGGAMRKLGDLKGEVE